MVSEQNILVTTTTLDSAVKQSLYGFLVFLIVDEELPDYIMVMVANKKTSEQMTDDLSLFLGNNTIKFTTW